MKKLLVTTAIATMAFTGAASAQSLLERVLSDVNSNMQNVTGIFANTADNLLAGALQDVVSVGGTTTTVDRTVQPGDIITVRVPAIGGDPAVDRVAVVGPNGELFQPGTNTRIEDAAGAPIGTAAVTLGSTLLQNNTGVLTVDGGALTGAGPITLTGFSIATQTTNVGGQVFETSGINASVTNILRGLDRDSATTGLASAISAVQTNVGNIATTALGAVNTGDIELLGANTAFLEDIDQAIAGTSNALRQRVDNTVTQVGTTANQTVLAINSALNETNVNASVTNIASGVNANLGINNLGANFDTAAMTALFGTAGSSGVAGTEFAAADIANIVAEIAGGISTTALGAVNTGTIVSGADNQVRGVISSIVGNAATNTAGLN